VGTKLRSLSDRTLKGLEAKIEALTESVNVISVNNVGNVWYAHFEIAPHTQIENKIVGGSELTPPKPKRKRIRRA
jgi:hypothetical protein